MPIQVLLLREPDEAVSAENARPYLTDFILWLHEFLYQIAQNSSDTDISTGAPLFEESQISFLEEALQEVDMLDHFQNVVTLIERAETTTLSHHGLEGVQLKWKLSNINFWLRRFIDERTAALLERLLASVDALLKSILGAIGAGSAIEELKEAVLNSIALAAE